MSDDIDIEEHDVLDNPNIRRIFPDLSIIKKEIFQYEEGLNNVVEDADQEANSQLEAEAADLYQAPKLATNPPTTSENAANTDETLTRKQLEVRRRFKCFLDSLVDDCIENNENNSDTNSDIFNDIVTPNSPKLHKTNSNKLKTYQRPAKPVRNNNIVILGSKPNVQHAKKTNKLTKQLKIVLKNVSPFLNTSRRYCKDCFILFPNSKEFKCHMDFTHSIKTNTNIIKPKKQTNVIKCEICNITMLKNNFTRHFNRIHAISKPDNLGRDKTRSLRGKTKVNETNTPTSEQTKPKSINSYNCFHCQHLFESRDSLIEHLYEILNPYKMVTKGLSDNESTTKKPDIGAEKHSDNEKLVTSKIKRMAASTGTDKISNNKIKRTEMVSEKSFIEDNKPVSNNKNNRTEIISQKSSTEENKPISNNKNKRNKNISQTTSTEENEVELRVYENRRSSSRGKLKETGKCNSVERDESIDNNDNDSLSDHNVAIRSSDEFMCDIDQKPSSANSSHGIDTPKKTVYQCFICSQYITHIRPYFRHMAGHNIAKDIVRKIDKTIFDAQCNFCSMKVSTIKAYNTHVFRMHRAKYVKKLHFDEKVFQSVIFKCFKCDVFFLSANAAINHSEHDKIFVNWKCEKCNELFKITDKLLHMKQHSLSKDITSYVLSESALKRVLYKCLKCTVHFSELEYFLHDTCDLEIPSSAYCKTCDILINTNDMNVHELNHKKNLQLNDFPLIESDVITVGVEKCTNPYANLPFALTFCSICNCFLNNLSTTRGVHNSGKCATVILPRMCRKCGLVFTASGIRSHKLLHHKIKKLKMQSFYFYDIKTKKQIAPPIPKQPSCNICEVHFIDKPAIVGHECSKQSYTTCNICNIKLTQAAFKLHINYHQYKLSSSVFNKIESTKLKEEGAKSAVRIANNIDTVDNTSLDKQINDNTDTNNTKKTQNFLYTCTTCKITFDVYDKVVQHCHEHYDYTQIRSGQKMDANDKSDEFAVPVAFDPFYFRFDNDVWIEHIFANLTKDQINNVLNDSMYKFEHRSKMDEIQIGPNHMTLYKCDMCRSFIDPNKIFIHASNACSVMLKKYPCLCCGLCFHCEIYRSIHERDHDRPHITSSSYRIILFNKIEHQIYNKMMHHLRNKFILYQCRNCEVVVDKLQRDIHECNDEELLKCTTCGLLFYTKEFNSHVKHEKATQFQSDKIVIIMFGKLKSDTSTKNVKSSFSGTICDLSFYRCTSCGLCLKSEYDKTNHVCVPKSYITQCPKCYLYFMKKEIQEHFQFHDDNLMLGYDDFNSNIVTFSKNDIKIAEASTSQNEKDEENNETNKIPKQTIYKCNCGLHFLEIPNARKHYNNCNPKQKISKQSCIKCDLLFTPGELFDHLLKHHGNKKLRYKYDIINIGNLSTT